jgi:hypothetical protein
MKVVILKVETNTREVDNWLNADLLQLLWVTNAGSLQDQWSAECASAHNDKLPSLEGTANNLVSTTDRPCWDSNNASRHAIFNDDTVDLGIALKM